MDPILLQSNAMIDTEIDPWLDRKVRAGFNLKNFLSELLWLNK
jgi:hypothetical protein